MQKTRLNREQAIALIQTELHPLVVRTDKAYDNDPINYRVFLSGQDDEHIAYGEFGYKEYSKLEVILARIKLIKAAYQGE
ncbi:hypothetical protein [Enterobacter asburiae]